MARDLLVAEGVLALTERKPGRPTRRSCLRGLRIRRWHGGAPQRTPERGEFPQERSKRIDTHTIDLASVEIADNIRIDPLMILRVEFSYVISYLAVLGTPDVPFEPEATVRHERSSGYVNWGCCFVVVREETQRYGSTDI